MDLLRRCEAFIPSRIMFVLGVTSARADLNMFCVIMPSSSSCQAALLKSIILFYVCVRLCVSGVWCKHNIRRDFYCNVSVWCQLS